MAFRQPELEMFLTLVVAICIVLVANGWWEAALGLAILGGAFALISNRPLRQGAENNDGSSRNSEYSSPERKEADDDGPPGAG